MLCFTFAAEATDNVVPAITQHPFKKSYCKRNQEPDEKMLGEFLANWMTFIFKPANIAPFRELFDRENNQDRLKNITEFSIIEQHLICLICSGKAVEDGNHSFRTKSQIFELF
ncbi:hypothetical protein L5515_017360 [Caenorhabditis briggsae]|uniref:Uncharacterized protein n=1 Tax=Caenorhabditis briggsae TaxID=6238 RepID=A0AAE9FF63_CAEBR|nr:hypothetical protein L5515_017360 [Caenorhabditis briggsae]